MLMIFRKIMLKIKVCGLISPGNVIEVISSLPDFVGYIFYPRSPRYVGKNPDLSLFKIVPGNIVKVGVFVDEDRDTVIVTAKSAGIDTIQLHGKESPEYCRDIRSSGFKIIKAFSIGDKLDQLAIKAYAGVTDFFLFDTRSDSGGGSGKKFNWDILEQYKLEKPFFLSGGIGREDVKKIKDYKNNCLYGIDINSRFERSSGIKDPELVRSFIEEIKNKHL